MRYFLIFGYLKDGVYTTKSDPVPRQMFYCHKGEHRFSETGYSELFGKNGSFKEFEKVIGIGEHFLMESINMAEVAFSVSKECQGMGLGKILIKKIAEAARENGIAGLSAYVLQENRGMINLFKTLPYRIKTKFGTEMELSCKFDLLADTSARD